MKKAISFLLICAMLSVACFAPASAYSSGDSLRFGEDGKFKILMINDTQETDNASSRMLEIINTALDSENPDLVVFVGDNVANAFFGATEDKVFAAIDKIVEPLERRAVPFAFTFGNHDEECGVSNERQAEHFMTYANCVAAAGGPDCGTYNLEILSSSGDKTAFNLYIMDTNAYAPDGGYAGITQEQKQWYMAKSAALKEENNDVPVPSIVFEHIPVPEIKDVLLKTSFGVSGAVKCGDEWYTAAEGCGSIGEKPCSTSESIYVGQYESWVECGDVIGAYFGHDHCNSFSGVTGDGIALGYTPSCGWRCYGSGGSRGVRVIELDESNPRDYDTRVITYEELTGKRTGFWLLDFYSPVYLNAIINFFPGKFALLFSLIFN